MHVGCFCVFFVNFVEKQTLVLYDVVMWGHR